MTGEGFGRGALGDGTQAVRHIGVVWIGQVAGILLQLCYTAATSRAVNPAGFGTWAVALSIYGIATIFASAGISSAAARRQDETLRGDREIVTLSLLGGAASAALVVLIAPLWAALWNDSAATGIIRLLAIGVAVNAYASTLGGILRRQARFEVVVCLTLLSTGLAMLAGALVVWQLRQPWTLAIMLVISPLLLSLCLAGVLGARAMPAVPVSLRSDDARFGLRSLSISVLTYIAYTVPTIAMSRVSGANVLGNWNRAFVVGQLPLELFYTSITRVLYPRMRFERTDPAGATRRSSMLALLALITFPIAVAGMVLMPWLVPVLLGNQWSLAVPMSQALIVAAALSAQTAVLNSIFEVTGNFKQVWLTQSVLLMVLLGASIALVLTGTWLAVGVGCLLAPFVAHGVQLRLACVRGTIEPRSVLPWYGLAGLVGVLMMMIHFLAIGAGFESIAAGLPLLLWAIYMAVLLTRYGWIGPIALLLPGGLISALRGAFRP